MGKVTRSTTARDRHRKIVRRNQPPCHICELPIDYSLPYLHPGEFVIDHVIPLNRGGDDALHNIRAAHRQPSLQSTQVRPPRDRRHHDASSPAHNLTPMVTWGVARVLSQNPPISAQAVFKHRPQTIDPWRSPDDVYRAPKPPSGLRRSGRALWRAVMRDYALEEHQATILREACARPTASTISRPCSR